MPDKLTIVGIGASAGGLTALRKFFEHAPTDAGLAYVVVVHLSPDHESRLAELLQPHVKMPVQQVTKTIPIEKNHVYVIPPNANLNTIDSHLRLSKLEEKRRERAPIDHFFHTLANTYDGRAVGVILSGTGGDGTLGLKEIKENGGFTVAQNPSEAEYDGMPQSAIASGVVDLVLPLAEIGPTVAGFASVHPRLPKVGREGEAADEVRKLLHKVFQCLKSRVNRDFSSYKHSTVIRRIQRRMQLRGIEDVSIYLKKLREDAKEVQTLADDLLITVTSFFRDPEVHRLLAETVIPQIFDKKGAEEEIRIWSVGCATGEEAYTLAILFLEEATRRDITPRIQIFGSDLHHHSLKTARDGFYSIDIEAVVSRERLQRFFINESGGYQVRNEVREMVLFAPQNLLSDPPFSRIDLISCRNLMIYIKREVQRDIIELFHYALRPDGHLLLGTSETIDTPDLFQVKDKRHCIYQKRNIQGPEPKLPVFPLTQSRLPFLPDQPHRPESGEPVAYSTVHQRLSSQHAPPSILISPGDKLVHLSERCGSFLSHPSGAPTTSIFKLVRDEFRVELRSVLSAIRGGQVATDSRPIAIHLDGEPSLVTLRARATLDPQFSGFALVIFDAQPVAEDALEKPAGKSRDREGETDERARTLEQELNHTRQRLQAIVEEYETGQEEMRASNEEMQSTNEELRSAMEELETSKEELQSMNEELQTVNQENRYKVEELGQLSDDLQNLLAATDIATLFLDRDFRILRFTPKVSELFNIRSTDRGRPISDLTHSLGDNQILADLKRVLSDLVPIERELLAESGQYYLTRVIPYRSSDDRIEGIVITFVDISARKQAEAVIENSRRYAEKIIESLPEPLLVLTPQLSVKFANAAFYKHFHVSPEQTVDVRLSALGNGQWDIPELKKMLKGVLGDRSPFAEFQVQWEFENLGRRVMFLSAKPLEDHELLLLRIEDRTERFEIEENRAKLAAIVDSSHDAILSKTLDGTILSWNGGAERIFGYTAAEAVGQPITLIVPPELKAEEEGILSRLRRGEGLEHFETERVAKDGRRICVSLTISPVRDDQDKVIGASKVARDVTQQKKAENRLRLLWKSASALLSTQAPKQMLEEVFASIAPHFELSAYLNYTLSECGNFLTLASHAGLPDEEVQKIKSLTPGDTASGITASERRPFVATHIQDSDDEKTRQLKSFGFRSYVCKPLLRDDQLLGTLCFASNEKDEFDPVELDFLETISRYVTSAYERLRLVEQLRVSDRRKDEFLATLAHELRNPLAPIRTGLELLKVADDKLEIFEEVHEIMERQTKQLALLVDDLMDISRITRGKLKLKKTTIALEDVIRSAVEEATPLINEGKQKLTVSLPDKPVTLYADPSRLAQVISNLLNNAAKYTPNQGSIELSADLVEDNVTITVRDTGIGIPQDKQEHVFEMFSQIEGPSEYSNAGLGIGLTLVKTLTDMHGGTVSVQSEGEGLGSSFCLHLPAEVKRVPSPQKAQPRDDNPQGTHASRRVLIADDNESALKVLALYFEKLGHDVRTAADGQQAVEIAAEFRPEFALLDLGMPRMDGYQTARAIREQEWGKDIALVALTGWGQEEDKRKSKEAGFDEHIVKPANKEALLQLMVRHSPDPRQLSG
ncbi:chemotaxis protein CheB [Pelagicoccus sp. SDUM812002]|uniref:chemotaxis protein CheB n=1 Tax=Pelagicoccus sp. SDUM812002 TaxID=3041266 RepID=UPI00280FC1D2|nr:chemotaxis protein CheB [Pelagicoccus sp. SDUM812002]MDQ8184101.1 chemotaxis protein CheB [Pelagicoccus sp. SDUM812002]